MSYLVLFAVIMKARVQFALWELNFSPWVTQIFIRMILNALGHSDELEYRRWTESGFTVVNVFLYHYAENETRKNYSFWFLYNVARKIKKQYHDDPTAGHYGVDRTILARQLQSSTSLQCKNTSRIMLTAVCHINLITVAIENHWDIYFLPGTTVWSSVSGSFQTSPGNEKWQVLEPHLWRYYNQMGWNLWWKQHQVIGPSCL